MNATTTKPFSIKSISQHFLLIVLAFIAIFPIYWMFLTSLKPTNQIFELTFFPTQPTFEHYVRVWELIPFQQMLTNTVLMATFQMLFQILTALFAAYAFSRWDFKGKRVIFILITLTWLVPFQVTMIPNYIMLSRLGWLNTLFALIVPQIASAFSILLLYQSVNAFPKELIDSARIDGANSWTTLWRIIFPNLRAPISALGILLFISAWNEYFWPLLVTNKIERSVIQIGLQMFMSMEGDDWGPLMSAASMASIPIFLLYVFLQRQVIDSFVKSGLR